MAKVLLGWEYGAGFGHVGKLVTLAKAFREAGHTPVLALSDPKRTRPIWDGNDLLVAKAPSAKHVRRTGGEPPDTMADILVDAGITGDDYIATTGEEWDRLLQRIKPDLVICEYAPMLAMATLGRVPTLTLGTGFSTPPIGRTFPLLRFWREGGMTQRSRENETALTAAINAAAKHLGRPPVEFASDLFGGERVFVCCLPELDCYRGQRSEPAIGSLNAPAAYQPKPEGKGVFAYLANDPDLPLLFDEMIASGLDTEAYARNLGGGAGRPLPANFVLHEKPADLAAALPHKQLLIHHGGMSTAEQALRLGLPQLILPRYLEQKVTGALLVEAGTGLTVIPEQYRKGQILPRVIKRMAGDGPLRIRARKAAETIAVRKMRPALEIVMEDALARL